MNILIVKLSAVGDVAMSLPFLEALRSAHPRAHIAWVVEEASADLVRGHPHLDQVLVSRRKKWTQGLVGRGLPRAASQMRRFYQDLRSRPWDVVVDLQGLFKSGILVFLSGGRRRIGFENAREGADRFYNEALAAYDPDRHALLRYLDAAHYLGADPEEPIRYRIPVDPTGAAAAEGIWASGPPGPRAAVNPGAKWVTKQWPLDHWRRLVQWMTDQGLCVVLTGGRDERDFNRRIAAGLAPVIDVTGMTSLKTLAELYRQADLLVCPDTGPMHVAAAVGCPAVALFGPTAPWRTGPYGAAHRVLRAPMTCAPCFRKKCSDHHCMADIPPERVVSEIKDVLAPRKVELEDSPY